MSSVLSFLAYLAVFCVAIAAGSYIRHRATEQGMSEPELPDKIWFQQLMLFIALIILFAGLFILADFFDVYLILIFLAASEFAILLPKIVRFISRRKRNELLLRRSWVMSESIIKRPWLGLIVILSGTAFLVVYPTVIGYYYFGDWDNTAEFSVILFKVHLSVTLFIFLPPSILMTSFIMLSRFTPSDVRSEVMISRLGGMITVALNIALLIWAFGLASEGDNIQLGNTNIFFSPLLGLILLVYFVLATLLPYALGNSRAKK